MMLVEDGDGGYEIIKSTETYDKVIAFKTTDEVYASLIPFIESFPQQTISVAMRWLIENDDVREVMRKRVEQMTKVARKASMNGASE